jgi:glutamate N-acetyltransferase/amino-acid N-acetyltransferase
VSVEGAITRPRGFRVATAACGIRKSGDDLALLVADGPCAAAGVFTTNLAQAAPVVVSREHLGSGRARAVVVNAGCANAGTGEQGLRDARATAAAVAGAVGCRESEVVVCSTGVIGVPLPMDLLLGGVSRAASSLSASSGAAAARAIMTTDTKPKETLVEFRVGDTTARVGAMAKGAGMIAPNMATMLAFFTTDVAVEPGLLQAALREAVGDSLNRITVDGDTSTNDTAVILASGASAPIAPGGADHDTFRAALREAARELAGMIVRDGEGASRVAEVRVEGARSSTDADRIARTIAESPLVKTALYGGDPNWGRVLAAAGRAGVPFDVAGLDIWLGDVHVASAGAALAYDEARAKAALVDADPIRIRLRLREGSAEGWMWTCDMTHGYIDVNAHYRS